LKNQVLKDLLVGRTGIGKILESWNNERVGKISLLERSGVGKLGKLKKSGEAGQIWLLERSDVGKLVESWKGICRRFSSLIHGCSLRRFFESVKCIFYQSVSSCWHRKALKLSKTTRQEKWSNQLLIWSTQFLST
jgi:hypothetical protein